MLGSVLTNWQGVVERTVEGLGYDLVDAERSVGGLLRVYIDHVHTSDAVAPVAAVAPGVPHSGPTHSGPTLSAGPAAGFITVDDCEKVTRQLQHVLEVEGCAYERLEVSSPGLDRPLKKAGDYARFVGEQVAIVLKAPFQGRKKFHGELQPNGDAWRLLLTVEPTASGKSGRPPKPARAAAAAPEVATTQALDFSLDEVRDAHLAPVLDFKGRRFAAPEAAPAPEVHPDDEIEGDPSQ